MTRARGGCLHLSSYRRHLNPCSQPSIGSHKKIKMSASLEIDLKGVTCSVCMEPPHNAVLLLCSSHEKGCRPYMCDTSYHHSNCLELFQKAHTTSMPSKQKIIRHLSSAVCNKSKSPELQCPQCPLCRGHVKGWTVIGSAREHLNNKKRSCLQGDCRFVGTFLDLQKHISENHPSARPSEANPELEKKWRELVLEQERQDVISSIQSAMPNSIILGDYVIERDDHLDASGHGFAFTDNRGIYRDLGGIFYDRILSGFPRIDQSRRLRQRRSSARWFGFRPSFARFAWRRR
ncbi:hypothetical protein KSP39_PZI016966 [Platanthera zijinensis]|uniref:Uncharacterized protein n=1 Tax=Platanthera zijinensis TaxID=2320716 RepID=A0AAP0B7I3_9ASPA